MRALWLAFFLAQSIAQTPLLAQSVASPFIGQPAGMLYPGSSPVETIDDVQLKISQAKSAIPDKESLLIREMDRIDNEISVATLFRRSINWTDDKKSVETILERTKKFATNIGSFNCDKDAATRYYDLANSYANEFGRLWQTAGLLGMDLQFDGIRLPIVQGNPIQVCVASATKFNEREFATALAEISTALSKATTDQVAKNEKLSSAYGDYLESLRVRKASIQDKLNASQSAIQIGGNLPWLLLVLGAACVGTILGINFFDKEIQMEWVASGQVIQFVTVMILLSVILALGLSNLLKENTLGTLLGGLAGYVLAQGVGKSAAREVARATASAGLPSSPPPVALTGAVQPSSGNPPVSVPGNTSP